VGRRELVGRTVAEALPEVAGQGFVQMLDRVRASGEAYVGNEVAVVLQCGPEGRPQRRIIDFVFQPVRDDGGRITGTFVQASDATQRVSAQAALRESEAKFRAITNSIEQMIWSTRADGFHDYYNDRWYEYTGVPPGSTDGEAWNGMFHPDDQQRAWAVWRHSLDTGEPYHIEYRLRHRSGHYRWVLGRAQPVRDETGAIVRWFGTCTDIQDIVDAREVLSRSRAELERQVRLRTEQLLAAEEKLRQAHKMEAIASSPAASRTTSTTAAGHRGRAGRDPPAARLRPREAIPRFVEMAMKFGPARRGHDAQPAGVRAPAAARAPARRPQRAAAVAAGAGAAHLRRDDRARGWRCNRGCGPPAATPTSWKARSSTSPSTHATPCRGGPAVAAHGQRHAPPTRLGPNDVLEAGDFVRITVSDTGTGMPPEGHRARLRSLLHHEADRAGHGARPVHGLRLRAPVRRLRDDREPAGPGHQRVAAAAAGCRRGGRARAGAARARTGARPRRDDRGGGGRRGGAHAGGRGARRPGLSRPCRRHRTEGARLLDELGAVDLRCRTSACRAG